MVERTGISGILIGIAPRVLGETVLAIILADGLTAALTWQFIGMGAEAKFAASTFWVAALAISTIVTGVITPIFAAVMAITLSQLREARDELAHISQRDSLTGLLNRRGFELATTRAFSAARSSGAPLAALTGHEGKVACIDVAPDERTLYTASFDRTFKVWEAAKV